MKEISRNENINKAERALFNIDEFCQYMGIGQTKARELLKEKKNHFGFKIGAKWYISKNLLDDWINKQCYSNTYKN